MEEFKHIMFYEDKHIYQNVDNRHRYTSVTQAISRVKPDVDWDYWAVYKHLETQGKVKPNYDNRLIWFEGSWVSHKKYLSEARKVRSTWKGKGDVSAKKGTFLHLYLENLFNNKVIKVPAKYKGNIGGANQFYKDFKHRQAIYAEVIVADDEIELAGQVDRPFFVAPGIIDLYDYKTDAEIKFDNKYSSLKHPCSDLPDCNFSKYTLQVNLYRWIIEKNTQWKVREMKVVHLNDSSYNIIDVPHYNVTNLLNEVCRTSKQPA